MKNAPHNSPYSMEAKEVCTQLQISPDTLYAYVSRGIIRKIAHPQDGRRSLYHRHDFEKLLCKKKTGRSRSAVAASTISWGEPVLKSSITEIADEQVFYRGQNAVDLAKSFKFEQIFELLLGEAFRAPPPEVNRYVLQQINQDWPPINRLMAMLTHEAATLGSAGRVQTARRLLRQSAMVIAGTVEDYMDYDIAELLAKHWHIAKHGDDILNQALILCADHELNASAYAARVAASAKANLPASLLAGVTTLTGDAHGGMTTLAREWKETAQMSQMNGEEPPILASGQTPPGFGHPFYPNGDPRALALIDVCGSPSDWISLKTSVFEKTGKTPSLDFGLALVEEHLGLPVGSGLGLFALGRMAGWMAHIFEQRKKGKLIRPRAIYAGKRHKVTAANA
ncbi:citrate synthase [Maritalea porphyrae]|uniref:citrate synthase (unknown stereospecificity) n=2 Tax=Maritalea porphyrae TaxID=880732 RepID=A0ABQ5UR31_9HYPH|nr:citrate synthase [Maritalea porphyrae]